ncbi:MAG: ABC transporter substrate-binding protein [Spirochaetaceae bacterium]|nr:ABC transporter substrate-binding protein [Spirochaetaceae bacterium]MBQ8560411.1 ABC transporter substrate-binding protein [Spirochaetaceae bacterium]
MTRGVFFKTLSCLALTCLIAGLAGCAKKEAGSTVAGADKGTSQSATRTIVDHTGVEVVLPAEINRVVIVSPWPLPSVYCLYAGSTQRLVGIPASSKVAAENSLLIQAYPGLADLSTDFEANGAINIERLLELNPDVVFYGSSNVQMRQTLDNAGIPAVGFSTNQHGYNTVETYAGWIELLGQVFAGDNRIDTGRAAEIIQYGRDVESMVKERLAGLTQEERPRVMIAYYYDDAGGLRTSGSNFFGQYWIETAGGVNVASELDSMPYINMEQVYQWNPDAIFITNFSPRLPQDLLDNAIPQDDWSTVKAVQTGRVYKFPLGMYRWFPPSSDTPLSLMWMAKTLHPDLFADIDLDQMIKDYFQRFYNVELTAEDLHKIYNPPREAAGR